MRFEEILVLATLLSLLICGIDYFIQKMNKQRVFIKVCDNARSFLPVLLLVLVLRSFIAEPFRIPSGSMKPTLLVGDFILVNKFKYGVRLPVLATKLFDYKEVSRGDVIVFRHGSYDMIKRVVGLPGDRVELKHKDLYINGSLVATKDLITNGSDGIFRTDEMTELLGDVEHQIYRYPDEYRRPVYGSVTIPENKYFVLGDNRDNSEDSRFWGFVDDKDLLGQAMLVWLSWGSDAKFGFRFLRFGKLIK